MGFFPANTFVKDRPNSLIPLCGVCQLHKHCQSPKMSVSGKGKKGILVVGEAPGEREDEKGIPFVGKSGQLLRDTLEENGINLRTDCWSTNAIICHPKGNLTPTKDQIAWCNANIRRTLQELKPKVVITVGLSALSAVTKGIYLDAVDLMSKWAGWQIPCQTLNTWICPTYHPSFILRVSDRPGGSAAPLFFEKHVRSAVRINRRPWGIVPDYKKQVKVVLSDDEATHLLKRMLKRGGSFAYDYETDRLKPDDPKAEIVTASVCRSGKETVSFPFQGEVINAFADILESSHPKIAQNFKFEDRWSIRVTARNSDGSRRSVKVKNWAWCTMNQGHVVDNRPGCTGLGFQAYVYYGMPTYDAHIHNYLKSDHANAPNKIRELDLFLLCQYNGLDSLLTHKIAQKQRQLLGLPLFP